MKHQILMSSLLALVALPVAAALKTGDTAPQFTAQASLAGKAFSFSLADSLQKGPVVVYFYPSAFTGGCNLQAHAFAENKAKFDAAGATIIGVSLDNIERLNDFSADPKYCGGKIAVASDVDGKIAKSFDLTIGAAHEGAKDSRGIEIGHAFAERTTFIVGRDQKIHYVIGGMAPELNVNKTLEAVQSDAALPSH